MKKLNFEKLLTGRNLRGKKLMEMKAYDCLPTSSFSLTL